MALYLNDNYNKGNKVKLILLMGQSNGQGSGTLFTELPTDVATNFSKFKMWYVGGSSEFVNLSNSTSVTLGSEFGTEYGLADYLSRNTNETYYCVKSTEGSTGFSNNKWNSGDVNYNAAVTACNNAITYLRNRSLDPEVIIVWVQGETDISDSNYATELAAFYTALETSLNAPIIKIVDTYLSTKQTNYSVAQIEAINTKKRTVSTSNTKILNINTDAFNVAVSDNIHFTSLGQLLLGRKVAKYIINGRPISEEYDLVVDVNGNGDTTSITDAVSMAGTNSKILVRSGTYTTSDTAWTLDKASQKWTFEDTVEVNTGTAALTISAQYLYMEGYLKHTTSNANGIVVSSNDLSCTNLFLTVNQAWSAAASVTALKLDGDNCQYGTFKFPAFDGRDQGSSDVYLIRAGLTGITNFCFKIIAEDITITAANGIRAIDLRAGAINGVIDCEIDTFTEDGGAAVGMLIWSGCYATIRGYIRGCNTNLTNNASGTTNVAGLLTA